MKLSLVVDMAGCPNRCKHCWLGHMPNYKMNEEDDLKTIKQHNNKITDKALNLKEILSSFDDYLVNYENSPLKLTKVKIKDIVNEFKGICEYNP